MKITYKYLDNSIVFSKYIKIDKQEDWVIHFINNNPYSFWDYEELDTDVDLEKGYVNGKFLGKLEYHNTMDIQVVFEGIHSNDGFQIDKVISIFKEEKEEVIVNNAKEFSKFFCSLPDSYTLYPETKKDKEIFNSYVSSTEDILLKFFDCK